jgi:hypothetical protein
MKSAKLAALLVILNALLSIGTTSGGAAQAKHSPSQRGGQAAGQMSSKGSAHGNHQWSADPERGWVRGDESHGEKDRRSATKRQNQSRAQPKERGKKF